VKEAAAFPMGFATILEEQMTLKEVEGAPALSGTPCHPRAPLTAPQQALVSVPAILTSDLNRKKASPACPADNV